MWRTIVTLTKGTVSRPAAAICTGLAVGVAIFVYAGMMGVSEGIRDLLTAVRQSRNLIVLRDGSPSETTSLIDDKQLRALSVLSETLTDPASWSFERWVYVSQPRVTGGPGNVGFRGIGETGRNLRTEVHLIAGNWYVPGTQQVAVGRLASLRFRDLGLGGHFKTGDREWTVVGVFDAGLSAYDSEIWTDEKAHFEVFGQPYASAVIKIPDVRTAKIIDIRLRNEGIHLTAKTEGHYFSQQGMLFAMVRLLAYSVTTIFGLGSTFLVLITMMSTLRATRAAVRQQDGQDSWGLYRFISLLLVGVVLSVLGGAFGLLCALLFEGKVFGAANWYSFAEYIYRVHFTIPIATKSLLLAAIIGLFGSTLPAILAFQNRPIASRS